MNTRTKRRARLGELSDQQRLRFEYAWDWFEFHAEQRTKMFNFMMVGLGVLAAATITAFEKQLYLQATLISYAAAVGAIVFRLLDQRNRSLYVAALDVLYDFERKVLFGDGHNITGHTGETVPPGIALRVQIEDQTREQNVAARRPFAPGFLKAIEGGQHRVWMPFIAIGACAVFSSLALLAAREHRLQSGHCLLLWLCSASLLLAGVLLLYRDFLHWRERRRRAQHPSQRSRMLRGPAVWLVVFLFHAISAALAPLAPVLPPIPVPTTAQMITPVRFGGFAQGDARLDCSAAEVLVGSSDRTPLAPTLARRFESNVGLAQARANAVQTCLQGDSAAGTWPAIQKSVKGPDHTPPLADPPGQDVPGKRADRSVTAYLISQRAGPGPKPPPPDPQAPTCRPAPAAWTAWPAWTLCPWIGCQTRPDLP